MALVASAVSDLILHTCCLFNLFLDGHDPAVSLCQAGGFELMLRAMSFEVENIISFFGDRRGLALQRKHKQSCHVFELVLQHTRLMMPCGTDLSS